MTTVLSHTDSRPVPRVVVAGLASCFGCQLQITNAEAHLLEVLGQLDLQYWQLISSAPMPQDYDIAIIEGAVVTKAAYQAVKELRAKARVVIAIGACATTGGVPGMACISHDAQVDAVYAQLPAICDDLIEPRPVSAVVDVDFEVRCCPIDSYDFIDILQRALYGSNKKHPTSTMCGECKRNETECFYAQGTLCLGLVTRSDCHARCVNLGRPCNGCAGISPDANLESARAVAQRVGIASERLDEALGMFNVAAEMEYTPLDGQ